MWALHEGELERGAVIAVCVLLQSLVDGVEHANEVGALPKRFQAHFFFQVAMHGQAHFDKMETFYNAPPTLFLGGRLGGARITGRKPANSTYFFPILCFLSSTHFRFFGQNRAVQSVFL